jgi:hypothetical protein
VDSGREGDSTIAPNEKPKFNRANVANAVIGVHYTQKGYGKVSFRLGQTNASTAELLPRARERAAQGKSSKEPVRMAA